MNVLGIVPEPQGLRLALVRGTYGDPERVDLVHAHLKLPAGDESDALVSLLALAKAFLAEHDVDAVAILQAVRGKHAHSPMRIKLEAVIEISARESQVSVKLVAPQTLRAAEKRFENAVGASVKNALGNGGKFVPAVSRDCVLLAWSILPHE